MITKAKRTLTGIGLVTGILVATPVLAAEPRNCLIEYEISNLPNPDHHTDTGSIRKEFSVCTNSLEECRSRAKELVQHHEDYYRAPGSGDRPDISSIRIGTTKMTEECSDPV